MLFLLLLSVAGSRPANAQKDTLESAYLVARTRLNQPNAIICEDVVGSSDPEIIATDVKGKLRLYNALSGKELDGLDLGNQSLTAPVVGDFNGDNALEIAVATGGEGKLVILNASTLNLIAEKIAGSSYSLQPTAIPMPPVDGVIRDRIILTDQQGVVRAFDLNDAGVIEQKWEFKTDSRFQAPFVLGHVRNANTLDIVGGTGDGHVVIINPVTGEGEKLLIQQTSSILVSPLLVDLNQDGRDEIIVTLESGEMFCRGYEATSNPRLKALWQFSIAARPVGGPLLIQKGQSLSEIYILQASNSFLHIIDPRTHDVAAVDRNVLNGISTEVALIPQADRFPELAFGLKRTIQVTRNMTEWIATHGSTPLKLASADLRHDLNETIVTAIDERGGLIAIGMSPDDDGNLYAFRTGYIVSAQMWPTRTPWNTRGGAPSHPGRLDRDYARLDKSRRDALASSAAQWRSGLQAAMAAGQWNDATTLAQRLADYDPYNEEYKSLKTKVAIRSNLILILVSIISILLIGGYTAFKVTQFLTYRSLRRRGEAAFARGDFDESRRYYAKLITKLPENSAVALALGRVYVAQRDFSEETIAIYERAHVAAPGEQDLLHAYARALMLEPKTGAAAAKIYEAAIPTFPEPHLLEYALGRCDLEAGNYEEAGKRLRSALRGGVTSDALYRSLCEVYLKTGNFTAKALPVFQQQFPTRMDDREFLQAYLAACIDGKKTDPQVETLCQAVLELTPSHMPAYLHLATILLHKNQPGAAVEEVRQALTIDPTNPQAISMLAQCFLVQNRKDDEALQAYARALVINPAEKELLRAMTAIFHERGSYDEESIRVYQRSAEENPGDVITLRALAQTAQLAGNFDLAIRSIESLAQAGHMNPKLNAQLAQAYVKKKIHDPKAERVLREALRAEPNNAEYIGALSLVLCAQDRTESDCIAVFESHLANYKEDIRIARQLARSYIKADRYENALGITQRYLKLAPGDEELQRLNALASLYDNKIDEAVTEYQRILERNPSDKEALVNLALAYAQKLRTDDDAIRYYDRALTLQPNNDALHLAKARVAVEKGDPAVAVDSYKKALKARENNEQNVIAHLTAVLAQKPDTLRLRWFLVELLVSYGHLRESLEQLEFINQNNPGQLANILRASETILGKDHNNLSALMLRGSLLLESGQPEEAVKVLEKAYQLRPSDAAVMEVLSATYASLLEKRENAETRYKLGRLYYSQQEYDQAIGCFQKTAQDYRWEGESTKMLGKCFTGKGMLDLALQEYKKLVVDAETKDLLYDLALRYEAKKDLVGAKTVYRQLFAADIDYKDVKTRFEMLSGSTSDPMAFEKTSIVQQMSEEAARRYELLDELGRGAMGIVYRARDKELEEIVALKILPDNMSNNPEAVRRFKIEARNARKLSHPNIVRIHDIGEEMGRKYISMEYVDGSDLKRKVKNSPDYRIPVNDAIKYSMQIADALGYAHRVGVVHRDIKPANIMLTSADDVKVTDFGIAKMMDSAGEGTMIGAVIGTPLYMSPEQVQGIPVDNRADIYSFGIMFYELLSGRPPFTEGDLAYQHIHKDATPIEGLPTALWPIVAKCLAKRKEDRWDNAEAIYDALREWKKSRAS
ncbi:hypothetical protein BH09SUM1_BH09SUM1_08170 [soil metagenome]